MVEKKMDQTILEFCDKLIEDAQTSLMFQLEPTQEIALDLSEYTESYLKEDELEKNSQRIIDYLLSQKIRLFEEEANRNGQIIDSKEVVSNIFESISIRVENNTSSIHLKFNQRMIDLLL